MARKHGFRGPRMKNKKEETFIITEIGNGAYRARKMAEEAETESDPQPAPQSPPNQSQPEPKGNWFIKFESVKRFSKIGTFELKHVSRTNMKLDY